MKEIILTAAIIAVAATHAWAADDIAYTNQPSYPKVVKMEIAKAIHTIDTQHNEWTWVVYGKDAAGDPSPIKINKKLYDKISVKVTTADMVAILGAQALKDLERAARIAVRAKLQAMMSP